MNTEFFNIKDSLFDVTEKHEEALDLLVSIGFENLKNEEQRKTFGKAISLETALQMKKINIKTFTDRLLKLIENKAYSADQSLVVSKEIKNAELRIEGVLPCPVMTPLLESFQAWLDESGLDTVIDYDLKAASIGVDWIKESVKDASADELADIFLSAGFDLFFDQNLIGKFKKKGIFEDLTGFEHYNSDFENEYINLRDPKRQYSMIGVVPAIFLINTEELAGREIPRTWEDLLKEEFEQKVSLPVGDFDLFNAIILNIYKKYGKAGVVKLGRSLMKSMHPAEMVKSHIKEERPIVTIMPYFFTKLIFDDGPMLPLWPEDGAIISPIFMLSKKEKREFLKPVIDFLASSEVGKILSHRGRFPSIHPQVDNKIPKENKYLWLGWDFIWENDIGALINECMEIFNQTVKGV